MGLGVGGRTQSWSVHGATQPVRHTQPDWQPHSQPCDPEISRHTPPSVVSQPCWSPSHGWLVGAGDGLAEGLGVGEGVGRGVGLGVGRGLLCLRDRENAKRGSDLFETD